MIRSMLTTIDNPHSPFDDFVAWYTFDISSGYNTASFLARLAHPSDHLSEADYDLAIEQTIDEIVKENISGVYIKVQKEFPDKVESVA